VLPYDDVVSVELVAVVGASYEVTEISVGAALWIKQVGDILRRGRKHSIPHRSVDRQRPLALLEVGRLDEGREVRRVIDVEVCEEDGIELGYVGS